MCGRKTRIGTHTETRDSGERDTKCQREASRPRRGQERASSHSADVSPHLLEGMGSRVNVVPREAGPGVKFLQVKEKMRADVEALLERISGSKGSQAELAAAIDQLRRRKGSWGGSVLKTCSPEYNKRWNPKPP